MNEPATNPWSRTTDLLKRSIPDLAYQLSIARAETWRWSYTTGRSEGELIRDDGLTLHVGTDTFLNPVLFVVSPKWPANAWGVTWADAHPQDGWEALFEILQPHSALARDIARRVVAKADEEWPRVQAWLKQAREEQEAFISVVDVACEEFEVDGEGRDFRLERAKRGEHVSFTGTSREPIDEPSWFKVTFDRNCRMRFEGEVASVEMWDDIINTLIWKITPHLGAHGTDRKDREEAEARKAADEYAAKWERHAAARRQRDAGGHDQKPAAV